ncbi:hypothetical protein ACJ41O_009189 [Fusarium nematophilum]
MSRQVYAHYMVGLTDGQSLSQWQKDISDAQASGIDGFALNIGPSDAWTLTQLHQAYAAAEAASFGMFLSFDMETGDWESSAVSGLVSEFKGSSAQVTRDGRPLVSTFEGVKISWMLWMGLSWNAWPRAGNHEMSTEEDLLYKDVLGDKPYMMGVSPAFYTSLNGAKTGTRPANPSGTTAGCRSSRCSPTQSRSSPGTTTASRRTLQTLSPRRLCPGQKSTSTASHSALRSILPYFIQAYKAGTLDVPLPDGETAIAWYRSTSATLGSDGGTVWGQGGTESAGVGARDVVSVVAITQGEEEVLVRIGDGEQERFVANGTGKRASYFEVPFEGRLGEVTLEMGGRSVVGEAITGVMPGTGYVNFNALAIGL